MQNAAAQDSTMPASGMPVNVTEPQARSRASVSEQATQRSRRDELLHPRFYTTDYDAMNRLDVSSVRSQWDAMMAEYEGDNNHDHFQRTEHFTEEIHPMSEALENEFVDFMISSATSEFSGCVLYNEIKKSVSNPDIRDLMGYMARDESRHSGFINQALRDYGLGIDLGRVKREKKYTFFKPKYIMYATYLSEKIGYARYIMIYRQLERYPERRFHPIFKWFQRWCNDEFRHGESFALLMRAQPHLLRGANLLLIRFFLLAVYATMYVRDHNRPQMHKAMGLDPTEYDFTVFRITNEISRQVFPISLDLDHPAFRAGLDRLCLINDRVERAKARGGLIGWASRTLGSAQAVLTFARMYLLPVQRHELPAQMRVEPIW